MTTQRISQAISKTLALTAALWLAVAPAYGASKEMIQLQTQVQQLQEQMTNMRQTFDELRRAHGCDEEPGGAEHRRC